jgi:hypothetical protein
VDHSIGEAVKDPLAAAVDEVVSVVFWPFNLGLNYVEYHAVQYGVKLQAKDRSLYLNLSLFRGWVVPQKDTCKVLMEAHAKQDAHI